LLPHESVIRARALMQANPAADTGPAAGAHVVTARLRLLFIRWKAAAIAYRERQTALLALHRAGDRDLNSKRIYRGPIDDALERAAWLRKALKQP
jgi:hypothetical protein